MCEYALVLFLSWSISTRVSECFICFVMQLCAWLSFFAAFESVKARRTRDCSKAC